MQAVILCGGYGSRIRDVAHDIPKPMIPLGGKPILWHIMKGYAQHGIRDFVLCLGYQSWVIKRYFLDYHLAHSDFTLRLDSPEDPEIHGETAVEDWTITLAETGVDAMTGGRIKRIEKYLRGDTFMVTYGDGVADVNITDLLAFHKSHGRIGTVTTVQPPGRFGELDLDGERVADFTEKPVVSSGWISGGFFVFERELLDRLPDAPDTILEREPLRSLSADNELMAYRHEGFWHAMDSSRDHKSLNDMIAVGNAPWMTWEKPAEPVVSVKTKSNTKVRQRAVIH